MVTVLKIGGSLAKDPYILKRLCNELGILAKNHRILIVPGGADFADIIREFDKKYNLSCLVTHKMAVLAMDQYGLFLSDLISDSYVSYSLENINFNKGKSPILLPSHIMFRENPLENSWDITSDSIAAYIAYLLRAEKFLIIKDVDGIFSQDPKKSIKTQLINELTAQELNKWNITTSVDKSLPRILLKINLDCYIVNGKYPQRIEQIMENKKAICTHITI
ncbi:MAG: delta 1-pyrroline-5-carboxylate synthetase [Candidatus Bathyarchaeota archaeon]